VITYIVPTRNRHKALHETLDSLSKLHDAAKSECEIIVVDNASELPVRTAMADHSRLRVHIVRLGGNIGAAARNVAATQAQDEWLVMLDDDSHPLDLNFIGVLEAAAADVAAIGADIVLPDGSREQGGLPEVIIGCGTAIRRDAFLAVGGYDATFDYYAEEYDLCAKLIQGGWRIEHDARFRVLHRKIVTGRDFNRIVHRLVRNNSWVARRYAPEEELATELSEIAARYGRIAVKEHAAFGFAAGMNDLLQTLDRQARTPMSRQLWDRFTGLAHVRESLDALIAENPSIATVAIVEPGKNEWLVRQALAERGIAILPDADHADALVIGTLSPGPMLDALDRHRDSGKLAWAPWLPRGLSRNWPGVNAVESVRSVAA
jgi:GT2 family glycosyltransferase